MVQTRAQRLKLAVGYDSWPTSDVGGDRLFVRNYRVTEPDVDGWHVVSTRRNWLPSGIYVGHTTWRRADGAADDLLLIESYECPTRQTAHDTLLDLLAHFQMPRDFSRVTTAPAGVQLVDDDESNAIVTVGNLVMRFSSGGMTAFPARSLSEGVVGLIAARPIVSERLGRSPQPPRRRLALGESTPMEPLRGTKASLGVGIDTSTYLKLFARHGDVRAVDGNLVFVADEVGHGEVECYSIDEAGAARVRYDIDIDDVP